MEGGFLVDEFEKIFSDIFLRDSELYKTLVRVLSQGSKTQGEILKILNLNTAARIPEYLWELELAGFISRDYTWNIKTGDTSKLSTYRLKDNYLRFYVKYIEKNLDKIKNSGYELKSLSSLPEWHSIMGLQFENLILNNRKHIHKVLKIDPTDIISDNPYFQNANYRHAGCQIDYMVQTKFDTLYICEIKFSKNLIDSSIIPEVQSKINTLQSSKKFSCRPVLIHVNGVNEDVVDSDYFAAIIDAGELLSKDPI